MPVVDLIYPDFDGPNINIVLEATGSPLGSVHATLSDLSNNGDDTWVRFASGSNPPTSAIGEEFPPHTPPADHQRHGIRGRWRAGATGTDDTAAYLTHNLHFGTPADGPPFTALTWGFGSGPIDLFTSASFQRLPQLAQAGPLPLSWIAWSWGPGSPPSVFPSPRDPLFYVMELQIDCRHKPVFTAEVFDGANTPSGGGSISDTNAPTLKFLAADVDLLPYREWEVNIYDDNTNDLIQTITGLGQPGDVQVQPLSNGDYRAEMRLWSTIRLNDPFASDLETVVWEQAVTLPPVNASATVQFNPPGVNVCWAGDPSNDPWDNLDELVVEIRRSDCNGLHTTIHVAAGDVGTGCYLDRTMSLNYRGVFCDEPDHLCGVDYEVRVWGRVDGLVLVTDWAATNTVSLENPVPGNAWIRGPVSGDWVGCPQDISWERVRASTLYRSICGGNPTFITSRPGGRDYTMTFPTLTTADLLNLEDILANPLVWFQPDDGLPGAWIAPINETGRPLLHRVRSTTVRFIEVDAQPLADPFRLV